MVAPVNKIYIAAACYHLGKVAKHEAEERSYVAGCVESNQHNEGIEVPILFINKPTYFPGFLDIGVG